MWHPLLNQQLTDLQSDRPTGNLCHDYCLAINCDSYVTNFENHCLFADLDRILLSKYDTYRVMESKTFACFVRGKAPPADCRSTSNCTPQLTYCGGTLPDRNLQKQDLLSCIPNASDFDFDSKKFTRKTHITNDFFYNEAEKTFMNG